MDLLQVMAIVLVAIGLSGQAVNGWTQSSRDQILKLHNDYRKAVPGACDIKDLSYDMQLEREAKAWAQKCVFDHQYKSRGENIAWQTAGDPETKLLKILTAMWHGEVKDFSYGQKTCGSACHYTQLIWAKTTKVGCYGHTCSQLVNADPNAYFLVCFYSPAGNMEGEDPYKTTCGADNSHKPAHANSGNDNNNHNNNNNKHNNNNNNNGNHAGAGSSNDNWDNWDNWDNTDNWESDSWKKRR